MVIELDGTGETSLGDRARELLRRRLVHEAEPLVWTREGIPISPTTFAAVLWANTGVVEGVGFRALDPSKPSVKLRSFSAREE